MSNQEIYSDEIDFRKVLNQLLQRKKWIIRGVVISTILALVISFLIPSSFTSTGYFQFKSVTIPQYKNYIGVFEDANMLSAFIAEYHQDSTWKIGPSIFVEALEPVYGFGKNPKGLMKENTVLGVKIKCIAQSPEEAQNRVASLGSYLETSLVNREIWKYYGGLRGKLNFSLIESKSEMIELKLNVDYLNRKIELIEANMLGINPATDTYDRQVVKLDETTEKYLPPHQQLIATRVELNQAGVDMERLNRKMDIDELMLAFVSKTEKYLADESAILINVSLLESLSGEVNDYFMEVKEQENAQITRYNIEGMLQSFELLKSEEFRFASGPLLPSKADKSVTLLIVLFAFFGSLVALITHRVFISWWGMTD